MKKNETTASIRMTWPFARLATRYPNGLPSLRDYGIDPADYVDPQTRISHRKAIDLLLDSVARSGDPAFGVKTAELLEPGDFDALEYTARTCATLGEGWRCVARYVPFISDAAEVTIVELADTAEFRYRVTDGVEQPPAANDFFLIAVALYARRHTGQQKLFEEVRFTHSRTSYLDEYERVLGTPVTFNAPFNTLVVQRQALQTPLQQANPRISAAFERQIQRMVEQVGPSATLASDVRRLVLSQLGQGDFGMPNIAKKLAMSPATLRRRLSQENVRYADIVDGLRRELGEQHLLHSNRAIDEIAFILGFADAVSFHKAWKRWTRQTPSEYRARRSAAQ